MTHFNVEVEALTWTSAIGGGKQEAQDRVGEVEPQGGHEDQSESAPDRPAAKAHAADAKKSRHRRNQIVAAMGLAEPLLAQGMGTGVVRANLIENGFLADEADEAMEILRDAVGTASQNTTRALPKIVSAAEFTADEIPEPEQVICGVLHRGSKAVYGGPSKAMKTWNLLDLCLAVATGGEWMGFATTPGLVLYVNFELQPFALHHRLRQIAKARGCDIPDTLRLWNLRGNACPLDRLLPELLRQIEDECFSLIVPDPIYKTLAGRNENDAGDIGAVCNELEAVAIKTGAAVAFGAHFAKGNAAGKEAIDRVAGSGVWARDPDAIITATTHEKEGAFSVEMTLRNFPPQPPFVVCWQYPRMVRDVELNPANLRQPRRSESKASGLNLDELRRLALQVVKAKPLSVAAFDSVFQRAAHIGEKAARGVKAELLTDKTLALSRREPVESGGKYIGTPDAVQDLETRWREPELDGVTK